MHTTKDSQNITLVWVTGAAALYWNKRNLRKDPVYLSKRWLSQPYLSGASILNREGGNV